MPALIERLLELKLDFPVNEARTGTMIVDELSAAEYCSYSEVLVRFMSKVRNGK